MFKKLFRGRRRKDHDSRRVDVARGLKKSPESERLRRVNIPRLLLAERLGQSVVRRVREAAADQPDVRSRRRIRRERLPLGGLRSQRELGGRPWRAGAIVRAVLRQVQASLKEIPGERTVCQKRAERREELFKKGIAGRGRRRSPGQGGSYRRTRDSEVTCRRS